MGNLGYGAFPTHPGEVLKDEIEERGISQRQLAEGMGLTYSVVNEILICASGGCLATSGLRLRFL